MVATPDLGIPQGLQGLNDHRQTDLLTPGHGPRGQHEKSRPIQREADDGSCSFKYTYNLNYMTSVALLG